MTARERRSDAASSSPATEPARSSDLDSRDLFANTREVIIRHGAETYRLRLTSQNKLILTK